MKSHMIIGNYGYQSLALLQWAIEQGLPNCTFLSVDTHWSAEGWAERVAEGRAYAESKGVQTVHLSARAGFADLVKERRAFPNKKYQWCAGLLKGVALNEWLDEHDLYAEAILLMATFRARSRADAHLSEWLEESEHYNGRKIWYPLYRSTHSEMIALAQKTPLSLLMHRSLECEACIHATRAELAHMAASDIEKTAQLEKTIGQTQFPPQAYGSAQNITQVVDFCKNSDFQAKSSYNQDIDWGCGSPWACGE